MIITEGRVELRWFRPGDLQQMVALHAQGYPQETWTEEDFYKFIDKREGQVVKVLVCGNLVCGTLLYSVPGHLHVCALRRITVLERLRRQGLGLWAVNAVAGRRGTITRNHFIARVRDDNLPGQLLLRKAGFQFDNKRKRELTPDEKEYYVFERFNRPLDPD